VVRRFAIALIPPIVFGVLFIVAWQLFVRGADIKSYVLPAPSDIWSAFKRQTSRIIDAMLYTGMNALVGLIIVTLFGVLLAALATRLIVRTSASEVAAVRRGNGLRTVQRTLPDRTAHRDLGGRNEGGFLGPRRPKRPATSRPKSVRAAGTS